MTIPRMALHEVFRWERPHEPLSARWVLATPEIAGEVPGWSVWPSERGLEFAYGMLVEYQRPHRHMVVPQMKYLLVLTSEQADALRDDERLQALLEQGEEHGVRVVVVEK
jgi:hypothetical protein